MQSEVLYSSQLLSDDRNTTNHVHPSENYLHDHDDHHVNKTLQRSHNHHGDQVHPNCNLQDATVDLGSLPQGQVSTHEAQLQQHNRLDSSQSKIKAKVNEPIAKVNEPFAKVNEPFASAQLQKKQPSVQTQMREAQLSAQKQIKLSSSVLHSPSPLLTVVNTLPVIKSHDTPSHVPSHLRPVASHHEQENSHIEAHYQLTHKTLSNK